MGGTGQCSSESGSWHRSVESPTSQCHRGHEEGANGEVYWRRLWVHSQMSGGRLGATTGQQSQQLGRTGCGEEENEDELEPAGTFMSVVTITPYNFREQWLLIYFCFPSPKQLSFLTNFNLEPYSCSLTTLTHINSSITIRSLLSSPNSLQWKMSGLLRDLVLILVLLLPSCL